MLNDYKEKIDIIIFVGGHSDQFFSPNDFEINLPNNIKAYFATCETGLNKRAIAGSLGLPRENVNFNEGLSWANNSFEFITNVIYSSLDPDIAYQTYKNANKDYQQNPSHRLNWQTEVRK